MLPSAPSSSMTDALLRDHSPSTLAHMKALRASEKREQTEEPTFWTERHPAVSLHPDAP